MGVYTLGANSFHIQKMVNYAQQNWGLVGKFSDEKTLVEAARSRGIRIVLLYDKDALSTKVVSALNSLGIQIFTWKDQAGLEKALGKKRDIDMKAKKKEEDAEKRLGEIRLIKI